MTSLFRPEAQQSQHDQLLGTIRIGSNPGFAATTLVSFSFAAALVAFAVWGEVTRKARLPGVLLPIQGSLQIRATQAGVLRDIAVREGEPVGTDQPIFSIGTERLTQAGETAVLVAQSIATRRGAIHAERQSRELLALQRIQGIEDRLRSIEAELRQADSETELLERRVELAAATYRRFDQLAREGFVSEAQAQQRQEELIDLQGRVRLGQRVRATLHRDALALRAERSAIAAQLQTEVAQLERSLSALDQEASENDARRAVVVKAPREGTLTAINVQGGQSVEAGQTLATLIPHDESGRMSELEAQLFAPSRTAGFVRQGQSVWMRYAAYPYQKFGLKQGRVVGVSQTPISPQDLPHGQAQALLQAAGSTEPLYRITVEIADQFIHAYGELRPLKAGMTLDAHVIQERRAVWEWLLEPLIATSRAWPPVR